MAVKKDLNLLVVDGVINGGAGQPTTIHLTRSQEIGDSTLGPPVPEPLAKLVIQGDGGDTHNLQEQGGGVYVSGNLTLSSAHKYRIQITTSGGVQYLSDYVPIQQSPPIDSLSWQQQGDVTVYLNTHDPTGKSVYYRWDYTETWEYHSPLQTLLGVKNHLIYFTDSTNQTQVCWESDNSPNIVLGTSVGLSADVINQAPIATVTEHSSKLSARYSILVNQYVLTQPAYQYWQILQKNTQNLGTLFDPQPSQITGNIHRVGNPAEPVIGYMSGSSLTQKRLFIDHSQVGVWDSTALACEQISIPQDPNNFAVYNYPDPTFAPYYFVTTGSLIMLARTQCLNCLLRGGTNQKPGFW